MGRRSRASICLHDCLDFIALAEVLLVTFLGFKKKTKYLFSCPAVVICDGAASCLWYLQGKQCKGRPSNKRAEMSISQWACRLFYFEENPAFDLAYKTSARLIGRSNLFLVDMLKEHFSVLVL